MRLHKRNIILIFKIFVTSVVCAYLVYRADFSIVIKNIQQIGLLYSYSVFVIMAISVTINAYKWKVLLSVHDVFYAFGELHRHSYVAMFINNFLPTSIGGDGYRIYKTMNNPVSRTSAVLAVIIGRITGIAALFFLAFLSATVLYFYDSNYISKTALLVIGGISILIILSLLLLRNNRVLERILRAEKTPGTLKNIVPYIKEYRDKPAKSLYILILSLVFHLHNCMAYYVLMVAIDAPVNLFNIYIVLAILSLVSILPISINGIGVVDGAFIFLMGLYGVPYNDSFVVMLIIRAMLIPISIIGAFLYFFRRELK